MIRFSLPYYSVSSTIPNTFTIIASMKPLEGKSVLEDVSYSPAKSKLMEQAESVGATAINGLGMMLWQGALAFELWTGQEMPVSYIKEQLFADRL